MFCILSYCPKTLVRMYCQIGLTTSEIGTASLSLFLCKIARVLTNTYSSWSAYKVLQTHTWLHVVPAGYFLNPRRVLQKEVLFSLSLTGTAEKSPVIFAVWKKLHPGMCMSTSGVKVSCWTDFIHISKRYVPNSRENHDVLLQFMWISPLQIFTLQ